MKKLLLLLTFTILSSAFVQASEVGAQPPVKQDLIMRVQRENKFEKRLGLTEEQKFKARNIRIDGHEKLEPVIEQIRMKKQEARMVKMSRIAIQVQEERLAEIDAELKVLEKQAKTIRKQNMKEFESILTRDQKKILKQMKTEGRKKYHADHPCSKTMMSKPVKN